MLNLAKVSMPPRSSSTPSPEMTATAAHKYWSTIADSADSPSTAIGAEWEGERQAAAGGAGAAKHLCHTPPASSRSHARRSASPVWSPTPSKPSRAQRPADGDPGMQLEEVRGAVARLQAALAQKDEQLDLVALKWTGIVAATQAELRRCKAEHAADKQRWAKSAQADPQPQQRSPRLGASMTLPAAAAANGGAGVSGRGAAAVVANTLITAEFLRAASKSIASSGGSSGGLLDRGLLPRLFRRWQRRSWRAAAALRRAETVTPSAQRLAVEQRRVLRLGRVPALSSAWLGMGSERMARLAAGGLATVALWAWAAVAVWTSGLRRRVAALRAGRTVRGLRRVIGRWRELWMCANALALGRRRRRRESWRADWKSEALGEHGAAVVVAMVVAIKIFHRWAWLARGKQARARTVAAVELRWRETAVRSARAILQAWRLSLKTARRQRQHQVGFAMRMQARLQQHSFWTWRLGTSFAGDLPSGSTSSRSLDWPVSPLRVDVDAGTGLEPSQGDSTGPGSSADSDDDSAWSLDHTLVDLVADNSFEEQEVTSSRLSEEDFGQ